MSDQIAERVGEKLLRSAAPLRAIETIGVGRCDGGLTVRATKRIDETDPHLAGHFPQQTIFPGVFIIEGLRQAVAAALGESKGLLPEILRLRSVRFLAPLVPGDLMTLDAIVKPMPEGNSYEVKANCERGDGVTVARLSVEVCYGGISDA